MNTSMPVAKINGKVVHGQAHMQPGINNWIGICVTGNEQIIQDFQDQESVVVEFEGLFNCGEDCINGKGKAKVLHISRSAQTDKLTINIEGIEKPKLEKEPKKELKFSYNENLPVDLKSFKKR